MRGIFSFVLGLAAVVTIIAHQYLTYQDVQAGNILATLDWKIRMISAALALFGIAQSIAYTKTRLKQFYYLNRVGRLLAVLAILLAILPLYQVFLK